MALKLSQDTRVAKFTTPLGQNVLALERFQGHEAVGELFEFHIDAVSEAKDGKPEVTFDKALGNLCCVSIKNHDGSMRHFNGMLTEARWRGVQGSLFAYSLVLQPWLWMLSRVSDCHIFAKLTIPAIIKQVLGKSCYPFADFEERYSSSYQPLEYCVQYRETDLQFVCRLMEEAGIFYFFEHSEGGHKLILGDSASAHHPKNGGSKLIFRQLAGQDRRKEEALHTWQAGRQFATGKYVLKDYDYLKPSNPLKSENEGGGAYRSANLERYDYPGRYEETSVGDNYARFRLEAEQATDKRCRAEGDSVSSCPGMLMKLAEHYEESQNVEHLIVSAEHSFSTNYYRSGSGASGGEDYSGIYEFLPKSVPFRLRQITPKPVIPGPQTAVVTGKGEIDVDKHGRIMVLFHWDREKNKKYARWVRIAQVWAGKAWGGIYIPRVGMEVVVQFIDGDPDRPLVTGTVYNAENTVPYALPANKTIAGVKSNSSEGGGGYNEFIFEDKAKSEKIVMHAQKDLEATIEHDEKWTTHHDVIVQIDNNRTEKIGNTWKVEATSKIEFIVGTSKIVMDPTSITIESLLIKIKAQTMLEATSLTTTVKGDAILTLKGGLVLIN